MIKKQVTYTDYNGNIVTEDLYFDMSSLAFTKFAAKYGDFSVVDPNSEGSTAQAVKAFIEKVTRENNLAKMIDFLEDFILSAYGERASDGKHFYKTKEIRSEFENSLAFAQVFEDLMNDNGSVEPFLYGVLGLSQERVSANAQVIG